MQRFAIANSNFAVASCIGHCGVLKIDFAGCRLARNVNGWSENNRVVWHARDGVDRARTIVGKRYSSGHPSRKRLSRPASLRARLCLGVAARHPAGLCQTYPRAYDLHPSSSQHFVSALARYGTTEHELRLAPERYKEKITATVCRTALLTTVSYFNVTLVLIPTRKCYAPPFVLFPPALKVSSFS